MKKVVFMVINMNIGGTEKALLNMISEMSLEEYEITILMLEKYGGFLEDIPKEVKVRYLNEYEEIKPLFNNPPIQISKKLLAEGKVIKALNIFTLNLICKAAGERSLYYKYLIKHSVETEFYDIAVAYAGPMEFITYYVLKKINAKKKVQWVHFDVNKIYFNKKFSNKYFNKFDKVIAVSEEAKEQLIKKCPNLQNKINVKLNTIPRQAILKKSKLDKGFADNFSGVRILTVGRLSEEKGQDIAVKVCKKLIDDGFNIRWYCIGEGPLFNNCKELINELKINDSFKLLGVKKNPYPYMRECDIYVQPSRHEGFCITLGEANVFNKPIVVNNFAGAREQIGGKENCYIANSEEELYYLVSNVVKEKIYN